MKKIVLIDGNSIINRAFYGVPDLTNSEGLHTNAIYGFLNIMNSILDEEKPDYLTVAFDVKHPTFRHEMYADYKGTRKGMPDELREQVPVLKELLKAMGVVTLEKPGYEADDILGTIAKKSEKDGLTVSLVSGDRDLLQIATDNIKVRIPKTKGGKTEIENYNTQDVIDKYSVPPLGIIELKALMGDSSDNIPGVPKIGEKTATQLIVEYGCIENLKEHIPEITKKSVKETLEQNFDMAVMSKKLATIDINAPIEYELEALEIHNLYTKEAYPIVKKLGFKKLLERFSDDSVDDTPLVEREVINIDSIDEYKNLFKEINSDALAFKINNDKSSLSFADNGQASFDFSEKIVSIEITTDKVKYTISTGNGISEDSLYSVFEDFVLASDNITFVSDNLKNDLKVLKKLCNTETAKKKLFDVTIAAYLINPLAGNYETEDVLLKYREVKDKLKELAMYDLYIDIELPLIVVLADMEMEGILIKPDALESYGKELAVQIEKLEAEIKELAGFDFNINSPKQLGEILFEKMEIPGGKKTKTGYSTAADVLEKLAPDYPFVAKILEYRGLAKLKSTYVDGLKDYIQDDNRIRCHFNQTITATGRISSSDPNLQNIPIRTEQGRLIRKCFVPREGYTFVDADYSQIELRIMAHMSKDEKLISAYEKAQDIHRITASEVFHVPFDEVTDLQRRNAKAVNFGIIYGISSFGLSNDLSISRKEAKEFIENYFVTFPKVKEYLDGLVEGAKENEYVLTLFNRRRPIPELKSSNFMQRQFGERVAMNAPIQGTAADIMKIAMVKVHDRLIKENLLSRIILQVHDELLIEAPVAEKSKVEEILYEEMEGACKLAVSLDIDVHSGDTWYDAK
ncbi:MAG: DNA polymerase I [Lachnospiraceae bacterium]|nr:DNA polymerase I [Lachnospiraceae bacterium]